MIRFEDHVRALGPDKPSNPKPDTPTLADPRTLNFSKKKKSPQSRPGPSPRARARCIFALVGLGGYRVSFGVRGSLVVGLEPLIKLNAKCKNSVPRPYRVTCRSFLH